MLTIMCPNCRHRFPAPGCCEPSNNMRNETNMVHPGSGCYYGDFLVPRGYTSGGGCFINAPTIVHGPAIIQTGGGGGTQGASSATIIGSDVETSRSQSHNVRVAEGTCPLGHSVQKDCQTATIFIDSSKSPEHRRRLRNSCYEEPPKCHITTTCDLTGGSVTITTPSIQSGGCLIQSTDSGVLVQASQIEIRPKLSGGGCLVQKRLSTEEQDPILIDDEEDLTDSRYTEDLNLSNSCCGLLGNHSNRSLLTPPSGCQELPGTRRSVSPKTNEQDRSECSLIDGQCCCEDERFNLDVSNPEIQVHAKVFGRNEHQTRPGQVPNSCQNQIFYPPVSTRNCCCNSNLCQKSIPSNQNNSCNHHQNNSCTNSVQSNRESIVVDPAGGVQIQVNATVQLPASLGQCTVNITATTNTPANGGGQSTNSTRSRNNFNGGGLVGTLTGLSSVPPEPSNNANMNYYNERRDGAPTTPVSWLMSYPWTFDNMIVEREVTKLAEVKRLLQVCGWYYEGLSWQQSESLLKDASVGRWLMRDSSDSRYTFAISVQTPRGPTSVRVHYLFGRFRLDAEPRLAFGMPVFDCPIKMLEHYVEYSKKLSETRREVWVDYSGQLYSHINLTKPLIREVRSLSHLARLAVNAYKLPTDHLPPLMRNYLADYPYTL